ncbi:MAG: PEP-CTERM sorting domain-containing protein [bacterium]
MKTTSIIAIAIALLSSIQLATGATTTAFFYKAGLAGSYVAQNTPGTILDQNNWIFSTPGGINFSDHGIWLGVLKMGNPGTQWMIQIMAPQDGEINTGLFLANRWGMQDASISGFSWFGDGRGVNTSTTWFEISDFSYDINTNAVTSLAVDAIQFEETWNKKDVNFNTDPCAYISYRFNSSVGINEAPSAALLAQTVPEPSSFALAGLGVGLVFIRRKRM